MTVLPSAMGDNGIVYVTLEPEATVNIIITPDNWNLTNQPLNTNISTPLTYFSIDNNGTVTVEVNVGCTNSTNWILNTTPGHNQFNLQYRFQSIGNWTTILSNTTFLTDFSYNDIEYFGFNLYMPTTSSTSAKQTWQINFVATAK